MGGINTGRWFIGGIIAGVIIAVVDFVLNGMVLGARWEAVMAAMNLPMMGASTVIIFIIVDLVAGLAALWIYVGIRPRYGASATTAVYAGLAAWVLSVLLPIVSFMVAGLLPSDIAWTTLVVMLVTYVVATVVGAYFYQEEKA